jgi:hypothetical protein
MSASAAIADPLLRRAFGRRAREAAQRFRDEPLMNNAGSLLLRVFSQQN